MANVVLPRDGGRQSAFFLRFPYLHENQLLTLPICRARSVWKNYIYPISTSQAIRWEGYEADKLCDLL